MNTRHMPSTDADHAPTAADLERHYPRWRVWLADSGTWWASVRKNVTPSEERAGCQPYLSAETTVQLEQLLRQDEARLTVPAPRRVAVRILVWGTSDAEIEHALDVAKIGEGRRGWEFTETENRKGGQRCPLWLDDPRRIASDSGRGWAYVVYRATGQEPTDA